MQQLPIGWIHPRNPQSTRTVQRQIVALAREGSVDAGEHQLIVEKPVQQRDITSELCFPEFSLARQDFGIYGHITDYGPDNLLADAHRNHIPISFPTDVGKVIRRRQRGYANIDLDDTCDLPRGRPSEEDGSNRGIEVDLKRTDYEIRDGIPIELAVYGSRKSLAETRAIDRKDRS